MAGHSKWANIKRRKEKVDQKRGKLFSRVMKEVVSAVKQGGSDPKTNMKLKAAIQKAKDLNVPNDNIDRNIKKAGSTDQQDYVEMMYELYGFGGVGLLVSIMTDNKNRIASEIRIATQKKGGTIATPGSVAYNFEPKGIFYIAKTVIDEGTLFSWTADWGGEDLLVEGQVYIVIAPVVLFSKIEQALKQANVVCEEAEIGMIPKVWIPVSIDVAEKNWALIDRLEEIEDVDAVYHNMQESSPG
jgi:YebC/PmpR family DNA-binding regulatory protein